MLTRSRKRKFLEGIIGTALLVAVLAAVVAANNFYNPAHVTLPAPKPMPTYDAQAASRAAQYRMAAASGNPAVIAQLRAMGIDPATGYPTKK